jgi:hypothetical protein
MRRCIASFLRSQTLTSRFVAANAWPSILIVTITGLSIGKAAQPDGLDPAEVW